MKKFLSVFLAFAVTLSMAVPAFAAEPGEEPIIGTEPVTVSKEDGMITLHYGEGGTETKTVNLSEISSLEDLNGKITEERPGWKLYGWYTEKVEEEFWGDEKEEWILDGEGNYVMLSSEGLKSNYEEHLYRLIIQNGLQDEEPYYTVINGNEDDEQYKTKGNQHFWNNLTYRWICTSNGDRIVDGDDDPVEVKYLSPEDGLTVEEIKQKDTTKLLSELEGSKDLYAMYKPTVVHQNFHYNGWGDSDGVLWCTRQYGSPVGINPEPWKWDDHVFDGWYTANGEKIDSSLETQLTSANLVDGSQDLYAYWHSSDDKTERKEAIVKSKTKIKANGLRTFPVGTIHIHPCDTASVSAIIEPAGGCYDSITWESSDETVASVEGKGLKAVITAKEIPTPNKEKNEKWENKGATITVTLKTSGADGESVEYFEASVDVSVGHDWGRSKVTNFGDCRTATEAEAKCQKEGCGETTTMSWPGYHTYIKTVTKQPTCTEVGYTERLCNTCNHWIRQTEKDDPKFAEKPATGHKWVIRNDENCGGSEITKVCSVCGLSELLGQDGTPHHQWKNTYEVDTIATCSHEGSQSIHCQICNAIKSSEIIEKTDSHTYGNWITIRSATPEQDGEEERICNECHAVEMKMVTYKAPPASNPPSSGGSTGGGAGGSVSGGGSSAPSGGDAAPEVTEPAPEVTETPEQPDDQEAENPPAEQNPDTQGGNAPEASPEPSPVPVPSKTSSNTASGVKLTWPKVSGAKKYRISYKTGSGKWKKIKDVKSSTTSLTWTKAKSGTRYSFRVQALNAKGKVKETTSLPSATFIAAPKVTSAKNTSKGLKITWKKSKGAKKYRVFYRSGESWVAIADTTSGSYTWKDAKKGRKYKLAVRCISADGETYTSATGASKKSPTVK